MPVKPGGAPVARQRALALTHQCLGSDDAGRKGSTHGIVIASRELSLEHEGPADRFLAAIAKLLDLTLVTADARLLRCGDLAVPSNRSSTQRGGPTNDAS